MGNNGSANKTLGQALLEIGRRDLEGGNRQNDLRHTSYRAQVGARGDLGDGWSYDVYAQYGYTILSETYRNEFSKSRVQAALEVDPATGKCYAAEPNAQGIVTNSKCVPLDIFNGFGSITPQMLNYVLASGFQEGYTEEQIVSGNVTGDLGEYGAKSPWAKNAVAVSFGTEYRAEYLQDIVSSDFALGTSADDRSLRSGRRHAEPSALRLQRGGRLRRIESAAGPGEALRGRSLFQCRLPLFVLQHRQDRYRPTNTASNISRSTISGLRASYERAVRAPNVLELFSPPMSAFSPVRIRARRRCELGGRTMRVCSECRHWR